MNKGTQTIETKKVVTNKVTKSDKVINAIVKPTKGTTTTKKVVNVIDFKGTQSFNKAFKQDLNSLGKVRSNILTFNESLPINEKLNPLLVLLLEKMKTKDNYEFVKANFEANSKGMYSSYKLLMYFRSNLTELQSKFK
jgi:hypothetical protein